MRDVKIVSIVSKYTGNNKRETTFKVSWSDYNQKDYTCTRQHAEVKRSELIRAVKNKEIVLVNGKISVDDRVRWEIPKDYKKRIDMILKSVRQAMEYKYGTGTDLAGRCIEASELIVDNLRYWGYRDCKTVEGWCKFDDATGCSDRPYDPHTWVELNNGKVYIDVTADQFNLFMDKEFKSIVINKGLPYGMVYNEPVEMLEEEDWY